jgi:uncharacterized protein (TIGR02757 family)
MLGSRSQLGRKTEDAKGLTLKDRIALNAAKHNAELRETPAETRSEKPALRTLLDPLFRKYHQVEFLPSDPLEFAHRFRDPWDQEVVALLAAVLAYGNVRQIRKSVESLLARIAEQGLSPSELIRSLDGEGADPLRKEAWRTSVASFVHRFNVGSDIEAFTRLLARSWTKYGSFGGHLLHHLRASDRDFGEALSRVFDDWERWRKEMGLLTEKSFGYLVTSPRSGSTCKRWCMLLRWMGRKDEIDLGLWTEGSPLLPPGSPGIRANQLVMPLDTHTGRISQYIGLTKRKSLNWKAAVEITERLRACDETDPVRYDFALARLGILDVCQRRFRVEICLQCDLLPVCRFARKGLSKSASRSTRS